MNTTLWLRRLRPLLGAFILIAGWAILHAIGAVDPVLLPSPSEAARAFWHGMNEGTLGADFYKTIVRTLSSFAIALVVAVPLGIVLGVLFGKLNISFSDSLSFSPGLTGGILMVALFLSAIGKTGPILWSMSGPANQLLRQLGLLLFLAEVGTSAGRNLMATFQESGWLLFGVGAAITLVPMLVAVCVGLFVFKINILDLLGTITGGMTSTPGLAAADSMTDSNIPSVAYATVYPIAMVFLILIIQVIASAVY